MRLPSLAASAFAGSSLWLLARRWVSAEAGLYAAALFTASSLAYHYGREARVYAFLPLLAVWSFHFYFRILERPTGRSAGRLAVTNAIGAWAHFTLAFAFLAQAVGAIGWLRIRPRAVAAYVGSQLVALVLFLPWLGRVFANAPSDGRWWLAPPGWHQGREAAIALAGGGGALLAFVAVVAVGAGLAARGARPGTDRSSIPEEGRRVVVLAAWGLVGPLAAFGISQWVPVFLPRYLIASMPGLLLLVAWSVTALPLPPAGRAAIAAVLVGLGALSLPTAAFLPKPDWRSAAALAHDARDAGFGVVVQEARHCTPFGYYFAPDAFRGPQKLLRRLGRDGVACVDEGGGRAAGGGSG